MYWQLTVAATASVLLSAPLILKGTPDVESYMLSIFSTIAFARDLVTGSDPWFISSYGFGVPLPTSTWLIRFPLAIPAALAGVDWLYAVLWLSGEFVFAFYLLRLSMAITPHRVVALVLLGSGLLSFSNLGTTYVDDWPEAFLGWAFLPACLWYIGRTLMSETARERVRAGAACAFVLGVFTGTTHHNELVTFFSGLAVMLAVLLWTRPAGVLAVVAAAGVALVTSLDILMPAVEGLLAGNANPMTGSIAPMNDATTIASYTTFFEPVRTAATSGLAAAMAPLYDRVPFFGLAALLLGLAGAVRPFRSREPIGRIPNDVARALAVGFIAYTSLTLLPSWIVLNLPRMWTFRDGQTVLGLLCAAMAIDALWRRPRLVRPILALQLAQMVLIASPIVLGLVRDNDDTRLFGYARHEHTFFDRLREAGVDGHSRLMLAGELDDLVRGSLAAAGVTAVTDFALEDIPLVNAWYRGASTPELGEASMDGRYGTYETIISWKTNLQYLDRAGLDVLGITHVAVLERDLPALRLAADLVPVTTFELPGSRRVHVLRNDDAWTRAVLLTPGTTGTAPRRPECPSATVYCGDYTSLANHLQARLSADWDGSSLRATLPQEHQGGTVLVSVAAGREPVARVDGELRPVTAMLGSFAAVEVRAGERTLELSVQRTGRIAFTLIGLVLLLGSLVLAILPSRPPRRAAPLLQPAREPAMHA